MKNSNIIQIRNLDESDNLHLESLKQRFYVKTNSQAAIKAVRGYMALYEENLKLKEQVYELKGNLKFHEEIISNVRRCVL